MQLPDRTILRHRSGRGKPIRVGVIARTVLDRSALIGIVGSAEGLIAVDLGDGGGPSQTRTTRLVPQVVVLDLDCRAASAFASGARVRDLSIQVLALLRTAAVEDVLALARAGITGFVSPDAGAQGLLRGIRRLAVTGCAYPPGLVAPVIGELRARATGWHTLGSVLFRLTSREAQVVQCLGYGLNDREIARTLHIGPGTVKTHIHRLLRKLGASRRTEAVERVRDIDRKLSLLSEAHG